MDSLTVDFLKRIFVNNHTKWWENLSSETPKNKYGHNARFLQTTLEKELSEITEYRNGDRRLFFFSSNTASSIDGRYKSLGVEEKYNPLDLKEHLIDGAIHRGIVWSLGNPHNVPHPVEAVSLYVVQHNSRPMSAPDADIYFPILISIHKLGIHVVFINEKTGEYWRITESSSKLSLPKWLAEKDSPIQWDRGLEKATDMTKKALSGLGNTKELSKANRTQKYIPGLGKNGEYTELIIDNSCKAAIIDYGNQWRLIEIGLLLRSCGYDAVKVIYNREKHKNKKDQIKELKVAGRGVERRVAEEMLKRFAIDIDWRTAI